MLSSHRVHGPRAVSRRSVLAVSAAALASALLPLSKISEIAVANEAHTAAMRAYASLLAGLMEEDYGAAWLEFQLVELAEGMTPALTVTTVLPSGPRNVSLFHYTEEDGAALIASEGGSRGWVYYIPETGLVCCSGNHSSASWDYLYRVDGQGAPLVASMNGGYEEPNFFESAPTTATYTAHGAETDADGYIAAVRDALGFDPSLFFGMHLEMVDPFHSWVPMGSLDPSYPSYLLNQENVFEILGADANDPSLLWQPNGDPESARACASYLAKLRECVDLYGMPSISEIAYPAGRVVGCSYARIVPLGGVCQLGQLVVAYDNGMGIPGERYNVEVWDYRSGEAILAWQSHEFPGHEGHTYFIAFDQKGDSTYLSKVMVGEITLGAEQYTFFKDGSFGPIPCDAEAQYDGTGGYYFFVAGEAVSQREFQAYFFDARDKVDLSNNGGADESSSHHQLLAHTANSVDDTLGLLELGSEGWEVHFPSAIACAVKKALELPSLDTQPMTFRITEDQGDPLFDTWIRLASWRESEWGRCLSFLSYGGTEILAYPSIDRRGCLSFTFRTAAGVEVRRSPEPTWLDGETPSYWQGNNGLWY